jgi:hypothetical protein
MRVTRAVVGLALLAALAFAVHAPAADEHHAGVFDKCARACGDCQRECDSCGAHCAKLVADGKKEHLHTLKTCQDCGTHCSAAATIVARKGPFSDLICKACTDACARCGKACGKYPDDEHMKRCAEECRRCEKACREMLTHTKATASAKETKGR